MNTAKPTRKSHLKNDLEALIAWINATCKADSLNRQLDRSKPCSYAAMADALTVAIAAQKTWQKIPLRRRRRAQALHDLVIRSADSALQFGGSYSGNTAKQIRWGETPYAFTSRSPGERYCKRKWWRRTDACHIVEISVSGTLAMERNAD